MMYKNACLAALFSLAVSPLFAQAKPEDTEFYTPVPPVVTPGKTSSDPPSDAIVLFDGKNLDEWVSSKDTSAPAQWPVADGIFTVNKAAGDIQTRRAFTNFQLHIEWRIPSDITGSGQARGNSGIFLGGFGSGKYELQVLDNYNNTTYTNGQAGSIYKQSPPLVNVCKKPGEWQSYDVVWTAPVFHEDGTLESPARITVFQNGVLVQNNFALTGQTLYIGKPFYQKHGPLPIELQAHGDKSEPISYRDIWVRTL